MSAATLGAWTQLVAAVGVLLGVVAGIARVLVKRFPPRSQSLAAEVAAAKQEVSDTKAELAQARAEDRAARAEEKAEMARERTAFHAEVASCRAEMRLLTDYAHDLREHIALEKDPPPPDWPEGLRL